MLWPESITSVSYRAICSLPMKSPGLQAKCRLKLQHIARSPAGTQSGQIGASLEAARAPRPPACPHTPAHVRQLASFILLPFLCPALSKQCADFDSTKNLTYNVASVELLWSITAPIHMCCSVGAPRDHCTSSRLLLSVATRLLPPPLSRCSVA